LRRRDDVLALPIRLDRAIRSQSQQVHSALRAGIIDGLLAPGLRLPSTRALAEQLGVRRNAIVAAYEALLSDGLVEARHGAGTYVAAELPAPPAAAPMAELDIRIPPRRPFALGVTLVDPVLLKRLAAASRGVGSRRPCRMISAMAIRAAACICLPRSRIISPPIAASAVTPAVS
jgi:GntR family transcriptional regulator/MocR family aminotransferase